MATDTATPIIPSQNERLRIFLHALLFVAGFSLVFIVGWGGSATLVGQVFGTYKRAIAQVGGAIVILFGLATLGVIRLPRFFADTRAQYSGQRGTFGGSALMGIFFAAGWSPCIGATLGAILTLGISQQTVGQAMWLASGYSIGLGIPFLILALGLERASGWLNRMRPYQKYFKIVSGIFIIAVGALLLTNTMSLISIWAFKNGYYIEAFFKVRRRIAYFTAIFAGLLSFPHRAYFPLVPAYLGYLSGQTLQKA